MTTDKPAPPPANGVTRGVRLFIALGAGVTAFFLLIGDHVGLLAKPADWKVIAGLIAVAILGPDTSWKNFETVVEAVKLMEGNSK